MSSRPSGWAGRPCPSRSVALCASWRVRRPARSRCTVVATQTVVTVIAREVAARLHEGVPGPAPASHGRGRTFGKAWPSASRATRERRLAWEAEAEAARRPIVRCRSRRERRPTLIEPTTGPAVTLDILSTLSELIAAAVAAFRGIAPHPRTMGWWQTLAHRSADWSNGFDKPSMAPVPRCRRTSSAPSSRRSSQPAFVPKKGSRRDARSSSSIQLTLTLTLPHASSRIAGK